MGTSDLPSGRYDRLIDEGLNAKLAALATEALLDDVDVADQPRRLAEHIANVLTHRLADLDPPQRVALVNDLITRMQATNGAVVAPPRLLQAVVGESGRAPVAPDIPLSSHDLLLNAGGEPQLAAQLQKELASADRIDLIVAFVRWYGVRLMIDELSDAIRCGVPIRLLTTTYTGPDRCAGKGRDGALSPIRGEAARTRR